MFVRWAHMVCSHNVNFTNSKVGQPLTFNGVITKPTFRVNGIEKHTREWLRGKKEEITFKHARKNMKHFWLVLA